MLRFAEWLKTTFCIHEDVVSFEKDKLRLQCVKCLRQTDGWTIERKQPIQLREGLQETLW